MKPKIAIVYTKKHNESIVEKNRLKKEHPGAVCIETSAKRNKASLEDILEDDNYQVISAHKSLNARVARSEKARKKAKADALAEQHKQMEKEAAEKAAAEKDAADKLAAAEKAAKKLEEEAAAKADGDNTEKKPAAKKAPAKKPAAKKPAAKKPAAKKSSAKKPAAKKPAAKKGASKKK